MITSAPRNPSVAVIGAGMTGILMAIKLREAGIDDITILEKADKLVGTISEIARRTPRTGVIGEIGGFGGLFSPNLANLDRPVLVSSTDGVGTKLKIAFMLDKHDTIGIDLDIVDWLGDCVL